MSGGDNEFVVEMISDYLSNEPKNFSFLMEALKNKNFADIAYHAHKLRSAAQIMGANELLENLECIENLALQNKCVEDEIGFKIEQINSKILTELSEELQVINPRI